MKGKLLFLSVLFLSFNITLLFGQRRDCNCEAAFNEVVSKVDANYLGLRHKVIAGDTLEYIKTKSAYKAKAAMVEPEDCTRFITNFLNFFKDGHLFVYESPKYSPEELNNYKHQIKSNKKDIGVIEARLKKVKSDLTIEGKWTDGISTIGIIKEGNVYNAYILSTTDSIAESGELKATFTPKGKRFDLKQYRYNYGVVYSESGLYKDGTLLTVASTNGIKKWARLTSSFQREIGMIDQKDINQYRIIPIDEKTTLFSIPSFGVDFMSFKKFIKENESVLNNSETLIFDIRGNTGGNAVYFTFIEMIADQALLSGGEVGEVLASDDTRTYFERMSPYGAIFSKVAENIKNNIGKIVDGPVYPSDTLQLVKNKIKNVAILTDNACASAAESFILHAKSVSSKITQFGSPTAGVIDYTSVNSVIIKAGGNQNIYFGYPTSSWSKSVPRVGYAKTGIIPDVAIDAKVKDKVAYIIEYYKKRDKK